MSTSSRRLSARAKGREVGRHGSLIPKSQTPGIKKDERCQTSPSKKYYLCASRAYKDTHQYNHWHEWAKKTNGTR